MSLAGDHDPRIGTVLQGRYKVVARISQGGMGSVYRGERLQLGRAVAIKFLHAAYSGDKEFLRRFDVEARAMSRLSHPHCVSVIDFGVDDTPYVVMEYIAGPTLREVMDQARLPTWRALLIGRQVLAGLAHAHKHGIVHRDVKPANIMLSEATGMGDHIRILDFGLAKLRDERSGVSEQSQATAPIAVGTPAYMSPEQARGERVDARSDVYSAGVLLFELLTGKKPFHSDEPFALLRMHMEDPIPSLIKADPTAGFSPQLDAVIRKAMQKAPGDRYQTAAELAEALEATPDAASLGRRRAEAMGDPASDAFLPAPPPAPVAAPSARRRHLAILVVAVVAGLAGGGAAWLGLRGKSSAAATQPPDAAPAPAPSARAAEAPPPAPDAAPPVEELAVAAPDAAPPPVEGEPSDDQIDMKPPDPPAEEPPAAKPVRTVKDAERLIQEGKREEAIAGLRKLRRAHPRDARVHYLLGNLYFDKLWWSDAIDSYRQAIRANRSFKRSGTIARNAIRALGYDKTYGKAAALLAEIGKTAVPHLNRAAKSDRSATVRARAADLAKKIRRRR